MRILIYLWYRSELGSGIGRKSTLLETHMNTMILTLSAKVQELLNREDGQDLVEYGLLLALISTAAIASVQNVATAVNTIFTNVSTSLA